MPDWKHVIRERLRGVKLDGSREVEIVDELAQHLEDRYDALRSGGTPPAEAHRKTLEELKDGELLAEELRKLPRAVTPEPLGVPTRKGAYMSGFLSDLRIALRNMRTKLSFSLMVVGMSIPPSFFCSRALEVLFDGWAVTNLHVRRGNA